MNIELSPSQQWAVKSNLQHIADGAKLEDILATLRAGGYHNIACAVEAQTQKEYNTLTLRRGQHTVNFFGGVKRHPDGSKFFDMRVFKNKRDADSFEKDLKKQGFKERSW